MPNEEQVPVAPPTSEVPPVETAEQKYARLYETPPPVPAAPPPDPNAELLQTVKALQAEIGSLKETRRAPQTPPPIEAPTTKWFDYLRAGEWEKAEEDLTSRVRAKVIAEAETGASAKAYEAMTVQLAVDRYLTDLRSTNPDIVPLEGYLQAPVQNRIEELKRSGKIQTNADFIREYKVVVEDEVSKLRKITGQYRADGTQEARTRQAEVSAATPLQPQSVSSLQEGSSPSTPSPDVSLENYFARRKGVEAIRRGMGPVT